MGNEGGSVGGGEETGHTLAPMSPVAPVKFLCSYGGKIMPRQADGVLKYVGGETRIIAIPRDITFSDLMMKLSAEFERNTVLKYQVMQEDLDVLVSVRTNEDLKHMLDEHDRHENEGSSKLRTFLFPSNPLDNQSVTMDPYVTEQRYVDALNGMGHTPQTVRLRPINASQSIFSFSPGSSPKSKSSSPESHLVDSVHHESIFSKSRPMHKVHSSPSLCSPNSFPYQSNNLSNQYFRKHHHYQHYHQSHHQHHPHGHQLSRPPDPHLLSPCSPGRRSDLGKAPVGLGKCLSSGHIGGGGSCRYRYCDEHPAYSLPPSPRKKNPGVEQHVVGIRHDD